MCILYRFSIISALHSGLLLFKWLLLHCHSTIMFDVGPNTIIDSNSKLESMMKMKMMTMLMWMLMPMMMMIAGRTLPLYATKQSLDWDRNLIIPLPSDCKIVFVFRVFFFCARCQSNCLCQSYHLIYIYMMPSWHDTRSQFANI